MAEPKGQGMVLTKEEPHISDISVMDGTAYREEIVQTIDDYRFKLGEQKMDREKIQNRLKLLKMRDEAIDGKELTVIEKELWDMAVDIEEPSLRLQRNISIVVAAYTVFAFASFIILTVTDRIMLPSFAIPYSVLLMGLIGSLVSMFVKLPNIRVRKPLSYDPTVWFIIHPPVAIIMAGIFFGLVQVFVPILAIELSDESWPYWILAWLVGMVNWIAFYETFSRSLGSGKSKRKIVRTENVKVVKEETTAVER